MSHGKMDREARSNKFGKKEKMKEKYKWDKGNCVEGKKER